MMTLPCPSGHGGPLATQVYAEPTGARYPGEPAPISASALTQKARAAMLIDSSRGPILVATRWSQHAGRRQNCVGHRGHVPQLAPDSMLETFPSGLRYKMSHCPAGRRTDRLSAGKLGKFWVIASG